ncbi:16S rRNA (cytosine(1402)-N(4))-methyltransferase RsmH [Nesterenkonia sp.]|uniref:16S rRNA (cytosine(1402)-N(4))-methyltransferase RsmH n=1 Tax=Nesterenkonia sp. TaxID=704201 RepID=UPI0026337291|nr:16S rRNA (cytosine(1402)-N(4))-methyltransferase RsmH [Nesterenkonia sp.]
MGERAAADRHIPVMRDRCTALLAEACTQVAASGAQPVVFDATLGLGGHTEALLKAHADCRVIGVDRDPQALQIAADRLHSYGPRFQAVRAVYDEIVELTQDLAEGQAPAGVLFDLGVSSLQLDEPERGFAYSYDAPLDMRMDAGPDSQDETAAQLLARADEQELRRILSEYGEERFAGRIARRIVEARRQQPVTTTQQLAQLVDSAIPAAAKRRGGHPAKRTFQALRIAVNRELEVLTRAVDAALDAVAVGGRVVVLSYHSLEDRIVKQAIAARTKSSAPPGLPVELEEHRPTFTSLTRGAEPPGAEEIAANPRAASAKLRAAEKIRPTSRSRA